MRRVETVQQVITGETKLSAEELVRIPRELIDLSLAALKGLPGFPRKYKKPGVTQFPRFSFRHNNLRYSTEYKEVEGGHQLSIVGFSPDVNTHILISSGSLSSFGYHEIPYFGSRKKSVSFKNSDAAVGAIKSFLAEF